VSFSTSSSDVSRRYVLGLAVLVSVPALCLFALGIHLQPLYGDLTRLGGYAEREFGPNKPQQEFAAPLYASGPYSAYKDVLVLGDSFSRAWPAHQWQNYVAAATGWSIQTVDLDTVPLRKILDSAAYRAAPPKLFVYESVERFLPPRIDDGTPCSPSTMPRPYQSYGAIPTASASAAAPLQARQQDWRDVKLGFSAKYLSSGLLRKLTGGEPTQVQQVALNRPGLFSSLDSQTLLVYKEDISTAADWQRASLPDMACRVERMRQLVEADGRTRFVMMVAPNKLSAYGSFIGDRKLASLSQLEALSGQHAGVMVRADLALVSAIRAGEQDVYLPDDTHWSARGNQIAAETMLDFLRGTSK